VTLTWDGIIPDISIPASSNPRDFHPREGKARGGGKATGNNPCGKSPKVRQRPGEEEPRCGKASGEISRGKGILAPWELPSSQAKKNAKDRQVDMDEPIRCYSLSL
jgi:hypothetical protein